MRDNKLIIRSETEGDAVGGATDIYYLELNGTGLNGLALLINVPGTTSGCVPLLTVNVYASSTSAAASTDTLIAAYGPIAESTTEKQYILPFSTNKRSVAFRFDVAGASTPTFSDPSAWIVQGTQYWTRETEFN